MIRIKKGLNIPITGLPDQQISKGNEVTSVAVSGIDYVGMKPTMAVSVGDSIKAGQVLFCDKKIPAIRYTAPVSGTISAINRGNKRVLHSVVIERNDDEGLHFNTFSIDALMSLTTEKVIDKLLLSGLWSAFRTRPYSKTPDPTMLPNSIFVNAMDTRPLSANPEVVINEYTSDFSSGLKVLQHLTEGKLYLCAAPGVDLPMEMATKVVFSGPHPAGLPGTHIHFIDPVSAKKTVWTINYQDVVAIGKLFTTGFLWQERIVALAGPQVLAPRLIRTVPGADLNELTMNEVKQGTNRVISGSVLGGRTASETFRFLGRYHHQVSVIKEDNERSFMHYLSLGLNRFSVMPIYLSSLFNRRFSMTSSTNGSPRAMVPVGSYEKVMPMDILPTQLLRSLIVGDIETAEGLGMLELDEEDLALCTFVCPGKYEYGPILRDNLTLMEQEN